MPGVVGLGGGVVGGALGASPGAALTSLVLEWIGPGGSLTNPASGTDDGQTQGNWGMPPMFSPIPFQLPDAFAGPRMTIQAKNGPLNVTLTAPVVSGVVPSIAQLELADRGNQQSVRINSIQAFDNLVTSAMQNAGSRLRIGASDAAIDSSVLSAINMIRSGGHVVTVRGAINMSGTYSESGAGWLDIGIGDTSMPLVLVGNRCTLNAAAPVISYLGAGSPPDSYELVQTGVALGYPSWATAATPFPTYTIGGKHFHMGIYPSPSNAAVGLPGPAQVLSLHRNLTPLNPTLNISAAAARAGYSISISLLATGPTLTLIKRINDAYVTDSDGSSATFSFPLGSGATVLVNGDGTSLLYTNPGAAAFGGDGFTVTLNDALDPNVRGDAVSLVTLNFT